MPQTETLETDAPEPAKAKRPVQVILCDSVASLQKAKAKLSAGLRYGKELQALWDPRGDAERFLYQGVLAVALAKVDRRIAGWGELFAARPLQGEAEDALAFCRISRLDVAPAYRRRLFADQKTDLPLSRILLAALIDAAPFNAEVVAEVTPDAENLFEQTGFRVGPAGRWIYHR
jgi:GNAT superfamily N-acetyltransferase